MRFFEDPRVRAGGFVLLGIFIGALAGNYDVTEKSVQHVSDQYGQEKAKFQTVQKAIPGLTAAEACEHRRAELTAQLALQPMQVNPDQIPPDCPHPPVPKIGTK